MIKKYIKNINGENYVAVLYSSEFGLGWSTFYEINELAYDKRIIEWLLEKGLIKNKKDDISSSLVIGIDDEIEKELSSIIESFEYVNTSITYIPMGLSVAWIKEGSLIYISNYNGLERIIKGKENFIQL